MTYDPTTEHLQSLERSYFQLAALLFQTMALMEKQNKIIAHLQERVGYLEVGGEDDEQE
jgi:hypothetical protein